MNERIKDLAKQSGLVPGGYANVTYADGVKIMTWREHFDNPGSLERFAELIIRECAKLADSCPGEYLEEAGKYPSTWIKEHFGVE